MQEVRTQKRNGTYRRVAALSMLSASVFLFGDAQHGVAVSPSAAGPVVRKDLEILSLTELSGYVNGSPVQGRVRATINTGRGGASTCEFSQLPDRFTPGTFSTHT